MEKSGRKIELRGDRILRLRERLGWNQMEAAYKTHTNQGSLSRIERGGLKNVTLETLANIADGLGTSIEYIIGVSNDPAPRPQSVLDTLTDNEARLLLTYRRLNPVSQESLLDLAGKMEDKERAAQRPQAPASPAQVEQGAQ